MTPNACDALDIDWPDEFKTIIQNAIFKGWVRSFEERLWAYGMCGPPKIRYGETFLSWFVGESSDNNHFNEDVVASRSQIVATTENFGVLVEWTKRANRCASTRYRKFDFIYTYSLPGRAYRWNIESITGVNNNSSCLLETTIFT